MTALELLKKGGQDNKFALYVADWARRIHSPNTEDHIDELLSFRIRETEAQKAQRVRLTNVLTSVSAAPPYSLLNEIKRTDGITREIVSDNEEIKEVVLKKLANFSGGQDVYEYIFEEAVNGNKLDPNSFIIFERKNIINNLSETVDTSFFPIIVPSSNVTASIYENGTLVEFAFWRAIDETRKEHYIYRVGFTEHIIEVDNEDDIEEGYELASMLINSKSVSVAVAVFDTGLKEVPCMCLGAYRNDLNPNFFEPLIYPAKPIFKSLLRDGSFSDLTKTIHTFKRRWEYVKDCSHVNDKNEICQRGYYGGIKSNESLCKSCKGEGVQLHKGEQDVVRFHFPESKEELLDLSKLTHSEQTETSLLEFFRSEIIYYNQQIQLAVFDQEQFKNWKVQTATEIDINYNKIYNKLLPFSNRIYKLWELAHRVYFGYYGESVVAKMTFPFDFKLKTSKEIIEEYNNAKASGMPQDAILPILDDFLNKKYANSPHISDEIKAFNNFLPFKDKTDSERQIIMSNRANDDFNKVLWENFDTVKAIVKSKIDKYKFGYLSFDQQYELIKSAVSDVAHDTKYLQTTNDIIAGLNG